MYCCEGLFYYLRGVLKEEVMQIMVAQVAVYKPEDMGERLRKIRKEYKYSQEKFAELLNVSKDTVYNYEKGKTAIPHWCIMQLCQEFNISADYFFFGNYTPLNRNNISRKFKNIDTDNHKFEYDNNGEDLDMKLKEKIENYSNFDKEKIIDMIDVMFREKYQAI